MNLAGKCQGAFHCHSLSAWSEHDTIITAIGTIIILIVLWSIGKMIRG